MKTGEIGERGFLASISNYVNSVKGAKLGFDDDASDIPITDNQNLIVNVDTFVRKTDWLSGMTAAQVGRKTAVMTLSDLAAKGAKPICTMLSLCVPEEFEAEEASELVRGFSQYGLKASIPFIGGDMGMASDVVLTGVGLGVAPPEGIIPRNGAKPGDIVAVTGYFGYTSVAFEVLLRDRTAEPDLHEKSLLAAYKPAINLDIVPALAEKKAITASMDSSDGLGITLNTIAKQSKVSFVIERLPTDISVELFARENMLDEMRFVMQGGEEFHLVVTIPEDKFEKAQEIASTKRVPLIDIGYVQKGDRVAYESSEGYIDIPFSGYDNFKEWE
ncbi:MAG: thiamine-phosphate kinase [Candidatus Thorarchaeota archaeon]|nr:MAG: thiamine-phosphate kinase [Candidatus Thorarchaeota archaeon]